MKQHYKILLLIVACVGSAGVMTLPTEKSIRPEESVKSNKALLAKQFVQKSLADLQRTLHGIDAGIDQLSKEDQSDPTVSIALHFFKAFRDYIVNRINNPRMRETSWQLFFLLEEKAESDLAFGATIDSGTDIAIALITLAQEALDPELYKEFKKYMRDELAFQKLLEKTMMALEEDFPLCPCCTTDGAGNFVWPHSCPDPNSKELLRLLEN